MSRNLKVAAVQMSARPEGTARRLARADALVARAAHAGAQLVVLPEAFNTGYAYTGANFECAEPIDGVTATWMKAKASQYSIHLAGAFMLVDGADIYMSFLLFTPAGRMWRYDKRFPWAWEHGYVRRRANSKTVARTELGDFGMMICWDVGHRSLWKEYAGEVDMILVSSCPVGGTDPVYHFPDGSELTFDDLGPFFAPLKGTGRRTFEEMIDQQAAWLGVPCVCAAEAGEIRTPIPRGNASLLSMMPLAPWTAKYLRQAKGMEMSCAMAEACKVVTADGSVVAKWPQRDGEGVAIADLTVPEEKPCPVGAQPAALLPPACYLVADVVIPSLMRRVYREGVSRLQSSSHSPA